MTPTVGPGALHGFVVARGWERPLEQELAGVPLAGPRWPALVTATRPVPPVDPAFALQQLPGAQWLRGAALPELGRAAADRVAAALGAEPTSPWQLQVYLADPGAYRTLEPQLAPLRAAFLAALAAGAPALDDARLEAGGGADQPALVQLVPVGRTSLLVSVARPRAAGRGGWDLAPWPGGRAPVPEDRRAPSRAYRKLVEGFAWLGQAPGPGQTCVDLGGSPGGWAWTALSRGAQVIAVDRAPLEAPAAGHPALQAIVGDAFGYRPPGPVDWLLCDVICRPDRTIELVDGWMRGGLCRQVVATLKFTGTGEYAAIGRARQRLEGAGWPVLRLKHLTHHQNEVAVLASRR